jgi:hypothetical protein
MDLLCFYWFRWFGGLTRDFWAKFEENILGALWMLTNCRNGVSSYKVHRTIGVTQKSAWFMLHRLRMLMHEDDETPLSGEVEMDETFVCCASGAGSATSL